MERLGDLNPCRFRYGHAKKIKGETKVLFECRLEEELYDLHEIFKICNNCPFFETGLSVVICTTPERLDFLASVLMSVVRQNYLAKEVIIVTDKSYSKYISDCIPAPNLRVIESDGKGLSKARNKGVEASTGDIVLFIDDDVILPDPNLFYRVVEAFETDEKLGVYGVQVKPLFYKSVRLDDKYNWLFGCTDDKAVRPVGAFFAVRRECFNVAGLFNENLGRFGKHLLSGEETELFNRIQKHMGLKVVIDNSLKVYHMICNRGWKYILKRAFMEGVSKARFRNYEYTAEKAYLKRYLEDFPTGWIVAGATVLGFIVGKLLFLQKSSPRIRPSYAKGLETVR